MIPLEDQSHGRGPTPGNNSFSGVSLPTIFWYNPGAAGRRDKKAIRLLSGDQIGPSSEAGSDVNGLRVPRSSSTHTFWFAHGTADVRGAGTLSSAIHLPSGE